MSERPPGARRASRRGVILFAAVVLAAAAFPAVANSGYRVLFATQIGVYLLVAMGLNFLTGYGGQTSLGHGALMGVGAYVTAILTITYGWGFWPAMLVSMAGVSVMGALMALPALRVSSWYLALLTLGFAGVVTAMLSEWSGLTGGYAGLIGVPMPTWFGEPFDQARLFWLVAGIDVIAFVLLANLVGSRFGRGLVAVRDNPLAAVASGVSTVRLKLVAFVISAALAGLAGALFAAQNQVITPEDFDPELSLFFLLVVVLGGGGSLWGPVLGTVAFFLLPELMTGFEKWRMLIYGVGLLALTIYAPHGLEGAVRAGWLRLRPPRRSPPVPRPASAGAVLPARESAAGLEAAALRKDFGGVVAVENVTLSVPPGACHAIVGPNGSGKTTLLNLVSGYYRPTGGTVRIDGLDVTGRTALQLSRLGVARAFQTPKLLPEMTVLDNVLLGGFADERATGVEIALRLPRALAEARARRNQALAILDFVGVGAQADVPAGATPHGQQRLIEIARALLGSPKLLLLDEPAAGLSLSELDRLADLIRSIQKSGVTLMIVEHHLDLVGSLADVVTVLDRGRALVSGSPAEVFSDPGVVAAYMGSKALGQTRPLAGTAP